MGIPTAPRRPSSAGILQRFRVEWRMFQAMEASDQPRMKVTAKLLA